MYSLSQGRSGMSMPARGEAIARPADTSSGSLRIRRILLSFVVAPLLGAVLGGCVAQRYSYGGAHLRDSLQLWKLEDVGQLSFQEGVTVYFPRACEPQARRLGEIVAKQFS